MGLLETHLTRHGKGLLSCSGFARAKIFLGRRNRYDLAGCRGDAEHPVHRRYPERRLGHPSGRLGSGLARLTKVRFNRPLQLDGQGVTLAVNGAANS